MQMLNFSKSMPCKKKEFEELKYLLFFRIFYFVIVEDSSCIISTMYALLLL
jgi:hypothetical protein